MDYHTDTSGLSDTSDKVQKLMDRLKYIEARDTAMAMALEMAATDAGLMDDVMARWMIKMAREGIYEKALPLLPTHVGLTDEQFRSLRALIYG